MNAQNIFEDDWRDCLRAHFAHVIKERDTNNETSLITVLAQTGFTETDIDAMRDEVLAELGWTADGQPVDSVESVETAESMGAPSIEAPAPDEPAATAVEPESVTSDGAPGSDPGDPGDQHDEPPQPLVQMSLF